MSIVTVQLGQCGNQVGQELFSTLLQDSAGPLKHNYSQLAEERFFTQKDHATSDIPRLEARAVMVDMEPKVIAQTLSKAKASGRWAYPEGQQFCQKRGSGNNWAHGFCVHGPKAQESIVNMARKEVEKCDLFGGFLTLMSLAGGTGSGVGTYITQSLRDEFPHAFMLNQVVWPYHAGEVIVQNYNAALTLAQLWQCADGLLVTDNDSIHKICSQLLRIDKVSFEDLNQVLGHKLASVLQPVCSGAEGSSHLIRNQLGDILEKLVPQPEYKFLTVRNIPHISSQAMKFSTFSWSGLIKNLYQMHIAHAAMEEGIDWGVKVTSSSSRQPALHNKSIANILFLRGQDYKTADSACFSDPRLYPSWLPSSDALTVWGHPSKFCGYEKSAALLSNNQSPVSLLGNVVNKAWTMFSSRAYVHQYMKHGLEEEDFLDSLACLEQVLHTYKTIS